ncbi:MAG: hypothetical protein WB784_12890 [Rhodanobacteraceae bacterium]
MGIERPAGFHLAKPINYQPAFSGHPFAVSLAAFIGRRAFIMFHAERVLDKSGASNYSNLDSYKLDGQQFRTRVQCAELTHSDVSDEHDLSFLAQNGFDPTPAIYLRQLFQTTGDHNAEVVISYGERVGSCPDPASDPVFRSQFDKRLIAVVHLSSPT